MGERVAGDLHRQGRPHPVDDPSKTCEYLPAIRGGWESACRGGSTCGWSRRPISDLAAAVAAGTFREDLFYRLKVGSVELPPLRERARHVLGSPITSSPASGDPASFLSLAAGAGSLLAPSLSGNVRELENLFAVAAALAGGGTIEPEHLGLPDR